VRRRVVRIVSVRSSVLAGVFVSVFTLLSIGVIVALTGGDDPASGSFWEGVLGSIFLGTLGGGLLGAKSWSASKTHWTWTKSEPSSAY
jgi:hypothetical protein